jgi:hypothetical protein
MALGASAFGFDADPTSHGIFTMSGPSGEPREGWTASVEGALRAHFNQPDGTSRPGMHWNIELRRGASEYKIFVLAYLADAVSPEARADLQWQAQSVVRYVFDRLEQGWTPADGELPPITLVQPGSA